MEMDVRLSERTIMSLTPQTETDITINLNDILPSENLEKGEERRRGCIVKALMF